VKTAHKSPAVPSRAEAIAHLLSQATSPRVRAWLEALLTRGERAEGATGRREAAEEGGRRA
jgi:hypothetical protein